MPAWFRTALVMISQLCWHDLYLLTSVKPCSTGLLDLPLTHNSVSSSVSIDDSVAVRMNVTDTLIAMHIQYHLLLSILKCHKLCLLKLVTSS